MATLLKDADPILLASELVSALMEDTDFSLGRLADLQEVSNDHPDIPEFMAMASGCFALAVEAQKMAGEIAKIEHRKPINSLSRVPPLVRDNLVEIAKKSGVKIDTDVLESFPYIPQSQFPRD